MSLVALLVLAVGLAMDATAVAAARGACAPRIRARDAAVVAVLFGGLHLVMPLLGSIAGSEAREVVEHWDHWIAVVLLAAIGARMIWGAWSSGADPVAPDLRPLVLVGVAFATSIDALAIGITLPLLDVSVVRAAVMIGAVTALACVIGLYAGHRFGLRVGRRAGMIGGLVLMALGAKMLIEHLALDR